MKRSICFLIFILVVQLVISDLINNQLSENVSLNQQVPGLAQCQIGITKQFDADCVDNNQAIILEYLTKNPVKSNSNGNYFSAKIFSIVFFFFLYFWWAKQIISHRFLFFLLFLSLNIIFSVNFPWHLNVFDTVFSMMAIIVSWLFNRRIKDTPSD